MLCPACKKQIHPRRTGGVVVDICTHCGGIWFDKEEIREVASILKQSSEIPPLSLESLKNRRKNTGQSRGIYCPRCSDVELKPFNYASDSGILLDRCPNCGGIWADQGEIEGIASFLKSGSRLEEIGKGYLNSLRERQFWADLKEASSTMTTNGFFWMFMPKVILPVGDENPRQHFPWATISLILINLVVFACQIIFVSHPQAFLYKYGAVPANIMSGKNIHALFSSIFIHMGFLHIIGNMFFLWVFGDNVEDVFGPVKFLILYFICGIAGDIIFAFTHSGITLPVVGASAAISGLMGAYLVMFPKARMRLFFVYRIIYIPAALYLVVWFLLQVLYSGVDMAFNTSNIGWFAHIGGFLTGMFFAFFAKKAGVRPQGLKV
jgi:membrane associated rhomboid family serine protease/Zn-finger nucleic acid-binding protein